MSQTIPAWVSCTCFFHILPTISNDLLQNCTAPDFSAGERCFLKVLTVLHLPQPVDNEFQLWTTLLQKASQNFLLNNFWSCLLLPPSSSWKNKSRLRSYSLFIVIKLSIRWLLALRLSNRIKPILRYNILDAVWPTFCIIQLLFLYIYQWNFILLFQVIYTGCQGKLILWVESFLCAWALEEVTSRGLTCLVEFFRALS